MKLFVLLIGGILVFSVPVFCQCTDVSSFEPDDLNRILGAWADFEPYSDQTYVKEYSWGSGPFLPNGTIVIDRSADNSCILIIDPVGYRSLNIIKIEKINGAHFIITVRTNSTFKAFGWPETGEIEIVLVNDIKAKIRFTSFPIQTYTGGPSEWEGWGELFKIAGPTM